MWKRDGKKYTAIPLAERSDKLVYDTRSIWPDQPAGEPKAIGLRLANQAVQACRLLAEALKRRSTENTGSPI
ncbi:MAG: hypothetical protein ACK4SJ_10590 [Sphingorhabdus sp.]|nr:hypothetical protein [Sphingorhabdus sp.]